MEPASDYLYSHIAHISSALGLLIYFFLDNSLMAWIAILSLGTLLLDHRFHVTSLRRYRDERIALEAAEKSRLVERADKIDAEVTH